MVDDNEQFFYLADMKGRNLYSSPALTDFTGREAGSATGQGWHETIHPDDLDTARTVLSDAQTSRQSFAGWWRVLHRDGRYVWCVVGGMPFDSEIDGKTIGYLGSIHPLQRDDAFPRAGGLLGPENRPDAATDARRDLVSIDRIADLTLLAAAIARDSGETTIAGALDAALMKIGFRLAEVLGANGFSANAVEARVGERSSA